MAEGVIVAVTGPRHATLTCDAAVPGGPATLAILVELFAASDVSEADTAETATSPDAESTPEPEPAPDTPASNQLQGRAFEETSRVLAAGIARCFADSAGSTTARMREALSAADSWLIEAEPEPVARRFAGASVLVATPRELILAQAGPTLAISSSPQGLAKHPAGSPWHSPGAQPPLGPEAQRLTAPADHGLVDDPIWAALGAGKGALVHWSRWPLVPGATVVLLPTAAVSLETTVLEALLVDSGEEDAVDAQLARLLPPAMPAIRVAHQPSGIEADDTTGQPVAPTSSPTSQPEPAGYGAKPQPQSGLSESLSGALSTGLTRLRISISRTSVIVARLLARAFGTLARVLVSLLPERAITDEEVRRKERARIGVTLSVLIPVVALAAAMLMRSVSDGQTTAPPLADNGQNAAPSGHSAASDSLAQAELVFEGESATPLRDVRKLADLDGNSQDERRIAVAQSGAYVLNAASSTVDRVAADGSVTRVMNAADAVGGTLVAALVDLFWLPAPSGQASTVSDQASSSSGTVVALDAADRLWAVSGVEIRPVLVSDLPLWLSAHCGAGFDGRLYVVDRGADQLWRYTPSGTGPSSWPSFPTPGEGWMSGPVELSNAADIAIDGYVYLLFSDGELRRYSGGAQTELIASGVPGGLSEPGTVFAAPGSDRILIADAGPGRVVVLSADGVYLDQLVLPPVDPSSGSRQTLRSIPSLHDVWWDAASGDLYLVSGNSLFLAHYADR